MSHLLFRKHGNVVREDTEREERIRQEGPPAKHTGWYVSWHDGGQVHRRGPFAKADAEKMAIDLRANSKDAHTFEVG